MYRKISKVDKERLYQLHQNGGDYLSLADNLNIKRSTARAIINRTGARNGNVELQRGGYKKCKVDGEMKLKLEETISSQSTISLK